MGAEYKRVGTDDVLLPFLGARNRQDVEKEMHRLVVESAEPIINGVLRYKFHIAKGRACPGQSVSELDVEDIRSESIIQVIQCLNELRNASDRRSIGDFSHYVARITLATISRFFSKLSPGYKSEEAKICYVLTHQNRFALWTHVCKQHVAAHHEDAIQTHDDFVRKICGYSEWRDSDPPLPSSEKLGRLRENPESLACLIPALADAQRMPTGELLKTLFDWIGHAVELTDIVRAIVELRAVDNNRRQALSHNPDFEDALLRIPDTAACVSSLSDMHLYLQQLWHEICLLPLNHRLSILLDTKSCPRFLALFHVLDIASIPKLADAVGMSSAELWNHWAELPYEDAKIAELLCIKRQQVINLRANARSRLQSRMNIFFTPSSNSNNILF